MGDATVLGDMPYSATLAHILSYPIVIDSVSAVQENPYGAKTIDMTNAGYAKFIKPNLTYFETPTSYAKPYVAKVDELGDKLLTKVDEKIPVLKSESKEVKGKVSEFVYWPLTKANQTKDWAIGTYSEEYKKCGGDGIVAAGKASFTAPLVLSSDVLKWLSTFLQARTAEAEKYAKDKTANMSAFLQAKKAEAEKVAKSKSAEAEKYFYANKEEAEKYFNLKSGEAESWFNSNKEEAEKFFKAKKAEADKAVDEKIPQ